MKNLIFFILGFIIGLACYYLFYNDRTYNDEATKTDSVENMFNKVDAFSKENKEAFNYTCPPYKYGCPIEVGDARNKIKNFKDVQEEFKHLQLPNGKAKEFIDNLREHNVFVFDKALIERYKDATHYIVCVGVNESGAPSVKGATVIFAGVKKESDNGGVITVITITPIGPDQDKRLSEHPQKRIVEC